MCAVVYNEPKRKQKHIVTGKQQRQALTVHTLILILKTIKNGTRIQKHERHIQSTTYN